MPVEHSGGDAWQAVGYLGLKPRERGGLGRRSKSGSHELSTEGRAMACECAGGEISGLDLRGQCRLGAQ